MKYRFQHIWPHSYYENWGEDLPDDQAAFDVVAAVSMRESGGSSLRCWRDGETDWFLRRSNGGEVKAR